MREIEIVSNSENLSASIFGKESNEVVLLIASATGVKQEYYHKFSQYLSDHGITTITFDYTGIGRSLRKPIKELTNNAADWGSNDLENVIQHINVHYPDTRKVLIGHSIGGQLVGLAKSSINLDKIILVAAQSGYWKLWKGKDRMRMWFNWYVLFPCVITIFGYLNSKKISGMENLPKNVANQWRNWGKNNNYILSDNTIEKTYYDEIKTDLTAFSIDDDSFAPKEAVEWMTEKYENSNKKSIHVKPDEFNVKKIGHFGIFKEKFKDSLWKELMNEIK